MNECDHVVGYNYKIDNFMTKAFIPDFSRKNILDADKDIYFNFCPKCGNKLKEPE